MQKTVLITGASSGIGEAAAIRFAKAGWNVAATSRSARTEQFATWPTIRVYALDVTDRSSITKAFRQAREDFGTIDVVVNNAGYGLDGVFEAIESEQIRQQFETNVFGLMAVTKEAIQIMRPQGSGTIIQVTSMAGRIAFPLYSMYNASKWAVEGFSESLQYEVRQFGIKIKIIEPGVIQTDFYRRSRQSAEADVSLGYDAFTHKVAATTQNAGKKGRPPEIVADTIFKAATDRSSRLRYVIGAPAPLLLAVRRFVPERVFFFLMRKGYKI